MTAGETNAEVEGVRLIRMDVIRRMQNFRTPRRETGQMRRSRERLPRVTLREIAECRPHSVPLSSPGRLNQGRRIAEMRFRLWMERMPRGILVIPISATAC